MGYFGDKIRRYDEKRNLAKDKILYMDDLRNTVSVPHAMIKGFLNALVIALFIALWEHFGEAGSASEKFIMWSAGVLFVIAIINLIGLAWYRSVTTGFYAFWTDWIDEKFLGRTQESRPQTKTAEAPQQTTDPNTYVPMDDL